MMRIDFITLFPEVVQNYLSTALIGRAQAQQILDVHIHNLRDEAVGKYKSVDDTVYGGSDGALIQYEPLKKSLEKIEKKSNYHVVYLSPQGQKLNQNKLHELKKYDQLILISGRYAGIDQRFLSQHVDEEISIGDFILSGGELPGLTLIEALSRVIPGVLGNPQSEVCDSFSDHGLLEAPQFTKPAEIDGHAVPAILMSGDHKKIHEWQQNMSVLVTLKKRPDLLTAQNKIAWVKVQKFYKDMSAAEKELLQITNLESALIKWAEVKS